MKDISAIHQSIFPTLQLMEEKRIKNARQGVNILLGIFGVVLLCSAIGFYFATKSGSLPIPLFIVGGILIVILTIIFFTKKSKVKKEFKNEVITKIIQAVDTSFEYLPQAFISSEEFRASQLFGSRPDRYNGEDYLSGRLGKTDFEFSEIHAQDQSTDSDGNTTYSTIFKGLFLIADFHKNFVGHTVVVPDHLGDGWFGRVFSGIGKSGKKAAKMENPEFEKMFDVFTTDQVEARYILSTSMLENIMRLKKQFGSSVYFAFLNSCVYVAISWNRKFLEPDLSKSLLDENTTRQYLTDIWSCLEIIEELNLNTRIWSKQ